MNPWILLAFAIMIEVTGTNCIKASEGFTKPLPTLIAIIAFVCALYLLSIISKTLPIGIVYAVWSGAGIILTAIIGYFVFGQKLDLAGFIGIGLILAGVFIINLFSTPSN
ncbi:multidrug efflux SMR transporter [Actinobacillus porcinus]|uniref:DMT family transporter n=1 Tax=Actinobacillus porcinus TaxID=51048 RepID=UPI002356258F|nr:SMR family transporter [Actinobacillus porcinus]MCI5765016.1 SMR family transporter [Actinobacillus porcinus]MDY5422503.1 SMR family transporter [Actinobacillus porcinus]